ncbi:hypothetical protein [Vibrio sp. Vb1755]|uniref:hypothetical protein n=1 Tax=Vibrio sp. Vb1755 TaxID=3074645 RepID=UPI002964013B|nr:hypothetical protein [Vibrio sp. Vb1755]MDW1831637.1 hypothetical protein [Vibrio sp. Vb1755]
MFEVGKLASKHLTILASLQILLLLALFNLNAKEVIAIPVVGGSMERLDTLSILLVVAGIFGSMEVHVVFVLPNEACFKLQQYFM